MTDTSIGIDSLQPKILVSGSLRSPFASPPLSSILGEFADVALKGVQRVGGAAQFIEASDPQMTAQDALEEVDGLLVLGGGDADPALYGQEASVGTIYGVNPEADRFERDLITGAIARNLPVLGICRGAQLLNIAGSGTLVQELGAGTMHYRSADNSVMTGHPVSILPDTHLSRVYGSTELHVRSGHHQAIAAVGDGFRVAARAADGVVEAIEAERERWVVGVQWHPEDPEAPTADLDKLLNHFVIASAGRRLRFPTCRKGELT